MNLNFLLVFFEGVLSFFSPCILPILPLYFGYLGGGAKYKAEDGTIRYHQKKVFLYTSFFVFGICASFLILGLSFTALGSFVERYQTEIAILSGIIIIIFGLFQLGIIKIKVFHQEHKLKTKMNPNQLNLLATFFLGFTFSFAWTPCVGPTLSSVLLLVASSSRMMGGLYMAFYAGGFVLPFLVLGLFTSQVLNFLKKKQTLLQNVVKVSGVMIVIVGALLVYQNGVTLYQLSKSRNQLTTEVMRQNYSEKVIVLNFLDRGCQGCQTEMSLLQQLYEDYDKNKQEVVVLGIVQSQNDLEKEKNDAYFQKLGYTFPILHDQGNLEREHEVKAYPTTVVLNQKGKKSSKIIGVFEERYLKAVIKDVLQDPCNTSVC